MREEMNIKQGKRREKRGDTATREGGGCGAEERNVTADKGVSIAGRWCEASIIRASYNESHGE